MASDFVCRVSFTTPMFFGGGVFCFSGIVFNTCDCEGGTYKIDTPVFAGYRFRYLCFLAEVPFVSRVVFSIPVIAKGGTYKIDTPVFAGYRFRHLYFLAEASFVSRVSFSIPVVMVGLPFFVPSSVSFCVSGIENDTYKFENSYFLNIFVISTFAYMTNDEFFKKENPIGWLFQRFPELNAGQIAKAMGINETLFRNYINGSKQPSASRVMDVENFLQKLGKELSETKLL